MNFHNPTLASAQQQQNLANLPQALRTVDRHSSDLIAIKILLTAVAAAVGDNPQFKESLAAAISADLPKPGQLVPMGDREILNRAAASLREMLPSALIPMVPNP